MKLPQPVQRYFEADRADDADALAAAFTADARVGDNGETHIGRADIAAWWREAQDKYRASTQPFQADTHGDVTTVLATVTGNFPGSPTTLTYAFNVKGHEIAGLEISA